MNKDIQQVFDSGKEYFDRKFDLVRRKQVDDSAKGIIHHEVDRVIDTLLSGTHERTEDYVSQVP